MAIRFDNDPPDPELVFRQPLVVSDDRLDEVRAELASSTPEVTFTSGTPTEDGDEV